jgi:hypothetical protein
VSVGDTRVFFSVIPDREAVSVVGLLGGNRLQTYRARSGAEVALLQTGTVPPDRMFRVAEEENRKLTWGIRLGGVFLVWIGILSILNPVLMLFRWIPILGGIVEFGLSLVAFAIAAATSGAVIAYSWFRHRPNLSMGIAIGALGIAGIALLVRRLRRPVDAPEAFRRV